MMLPTLTSRGLGCRRGSSLVFTAVLLLGVMAVLALAIDLGMLFTAHAEAQRAADAGALAAASAFQESEPALAVEPAKERAIAWATSNHIRGTLVDTSEVSVEVLPTERKVRVTVRRDSIPTWFARLIGIPYAPVSAVAAAQALEGGTARCLKPFAVPDVWRDADNDTNGNLKWDPGENWVFDPSQGDVYKRFSGPGGDADETGYGSDLRNNSDSPPIEGDYGREIQMKYTDPNSEYSLAPSVFLPWRLPSDPDMPDCSTPTGGNPEGDQGAAVFKRNICSCNSSSVSLGVPYDIEPGNMVGPTFRGVGDLIDQDPGAVWNPSTGRVDGSSWGDNWLQSPRVVKIALFDPTQVTGSGMQQITFNNFGLFFVEQQAGMQAPVVGRFLWYVDGDDAGGVGSNTGSLVLVVRLVE